MPTSSEGFDYTPATGLKAGLSSGAVIQPPELSASLSVIYDAIVVGAGYAGLIAARDLTTKGRLDCPHFFDSGRTDY